jgi:hypothetical protein
LLLKTQTSKLLGIRKQSIVESESAANEALVVEVTVTARAHRGRTCAIWGEDHP